jgi:zinc resistance-associated protein
MLDLLLRSKRSIQISFALTVAAVAGWSGFAYSSLSSGEQVTALAAERDAAVANYQQLQEAADNLKELEAKLDSARVEHSRNVQAWTEARSRLGATQQELAVLTKRLDQAKDRVSQTGSIRAEPPKPPARKP